MGESHYIREITILVGEIGWDIRNVRSEKTGVDMREKGVDMKYYPGKINPIALSADGINSILLPFFTTFLAAFFTAGGGT